MPIRLIIFDLDGTLIDSSIDITNALNYALEPYSFRPLSVDDTIKMIGEGITRLIERVVGFGGNGVLRQAFADFPQNPQRLQEIQTDVKKRFLQHYSEHMLDYTREYPGVRGTLEALGGYKKAVISNKMEALSREVLRGLDLVKHFDVVVGSDTTPEKKPSPRPVLKVLSDLGVHPNAALIVGDSDYDIDAGKAAGIMTVAVTYGYRPREVIAHADYLIDRMTDLVAVLKNVEEHK